MKKLLLGVLIGFVIAAALGAGRILVAQAQETPGVPTGPLVVIGGLRLKEGADIEAAEKLFKETLIPAMKDIDGLDMKILKRMAMERTDAGTDSQVYDYIMLAEIEKLQVFMQLMRSQDAGLDAFGDTMKEYAGHPYINAYIVIAQTKETE